MTEFPDKPELESLRKDLEAKQSATTWPDTLRAGRTVDEFLWKGDAKATVFQRLGLAVFALAFLLPAAGIAVVAFRLESWSDRAVGIIGGMITLAAGLGIGRNVFRRQTNRRSK